MFNGVATNMKAVSASETHFSVGIRGNINGMLFLIAIILIVTGAIGFWIAIISFWADVLKLGLTRQQCVAILLISISACLISFKLLIRGG